MQATICVIFLMYLTWPILNYSTILVILSDSWKPETTKIETGLIS